MVGGETFHDKVVEGEDVVMEDFSDEAAPSSSRGHRQQRKRKRTENVLSSPSSSQSSARKEKWKMSTPSRPSGLDGVLRHRQKKSRSTSRAPAEQPISLDIEVSQSSLSSSEEDQGTPADRVEYGSGSEDDSHDSLYPSEEDQPASNEVRLSGKDAEKLRKYLSAQKSRKQYQHML